MTIIVDFAKYQNAQKIAALGGDEISSGPDVKQVNDEPDAWVDTPIGFRARILLFCSVTVDSLKDVLSTNRRYTLEELSPHLQRDIGLIDYSQPIRRNLWE